VRGFSLLRWNSGNPRRPVRGLRRCPPAHQAPRPLAGGSGAYAPAAEPTTGGRSKSLAAGHPPAIWRRPPDPGQQHPSTTRRTTSSTKSRAPTVRYLTAGALPRHCLGRGPPQQRETGPTRTFVTGGDPFRRFLLVREGGVEPPRPCGHWNLNPARLPIPPPAHWVCRPSPTKWCERLPTSRRLARCQRWNHIPFPRPRSRPGQGSRAGHLARTGVGAHHTSQPEPVHVSTSYRSLASPQEPDGPLGQVRDTGHGAPLRSMAGVVPGGVRRGVPKGTSGGDSGRRRQPVDRADRGNQPISRRVDTISKQYEQDPRHEHDPHDPHDQEDDSKLYQDGYEGGGAPWES